MSRIFISHVEEDADIALGVALGLEQKRYTTWCFEVDTVPGPSYLLRVRQAIESCEAILVVISRDSLGSNQVGTEVIRAHECGKPFIPVLRDITHAEFQARQPEWGQAVGGATSVRIPAEGPEGLVPSIVAGLTALGLRPGKRSDPARLRKIRRKLDELGLSKKEEPSKEASQPATREATLARKGYETLKRWGRHPAVRLAAVLGAVAVTVAAVVLGIFVLIALLSGGGEGDSGAVAVPPTPGEGSPSAAAETPTGGAARRTPGATATGSPAATAAGPVAGQEGPWPRFWLTLPDVPPGSWSTSTPRGMNVYQTAFVSWEDYGIENWLTDPQSMLPDGEYYRYLIRGASADAPVGAKVSVSATIYPPDSAVGIGVDQGTFVIQEDGTWEGKTQVFPNDMGRSRYILKMEIRSADNQLLLRASLTIRP